MTTPSTEPRIFCDWLHSGWGNRISVEWPEEPEKAQYVACNGHLRGIRVGDQILLRFQSGKIGSLVVEEIEYKRDPNDLFFAKLGGGNYVEWTQEECEAKDWTRSSGTPFRFL